MLWNSIFNQKRCLSFSFLKPLSRFSLASFQGQISNILFFVSFSLTLQINCVYSLKYLFLSFAHSFIHSMTIFKALNLCNALKL